MDNTSKELSQPSQMLPWQIQDRRWSTEDTSLNRLSGLWLVIQLQGIAAYHPQGRYSAAWVERKSVDEKSTIWDGFTSNVLSNLHIDNQLASSRENLSIIYMKALKLKLSGYMTCWSKIITRLCGQEHSPCEYPNVNGPIWEQWLSANHCSFDIHHSQF